MRCLALILIAGAAALAQPGPRGGGAGAGPGLGPGGGFRGPGGFGGRQGEQQQKVEYKPEELCTVGGAVRSKTTGEPVSKAIVLLMRTEGRGGEGRPISTTTGADGTFLLTGVAPGRYRLTAQRNGFVTQTYGASAGGFNAGADLRLAKSESRKDIEVRMTPHSVVTGRVFDEDGEPVARANVQLMRYVYRDQGRTLAPAGIDQTNDLGEYRIFGVSSGKYFVQAGVRGFGGIGAFIGSGPAGSDAEENYAPSYYPGTIEPSSASTVDVPVGGLVQGIDIRLSKTPTYRVSGVISGGPESRRPGMVQLVPRSGGASFSFFDRSGGSWNQRTGQFEIRNVRPGTYTLLAMAFESREQRWSATVPVDVSRQHVTGIQVTLSPGQEISGKIQVEGQENPTLTDRLRVGIEAMNLPPFGGPSEASVGADGSFRMSSVAAASYRFRIRGLPEGHYVQSIRLAGRDVMATGFEMTAGAPANDITIVLNPNGASVSGSVSDAKGDPAPNAKVVLMPPTDQPGHDLLIQRVMADQGGQFQLSGVPPGDYRLYAFTEIDEGMDRDPEFLKKHESRAEKITLRESGQETKTIRAIAAPSQ